jgi:hypothetical protein
MTQNAHGAASDSPCVWASNKKPWSNGTTTNTDTFPVMIYLPTAQVVSLCTAKWHLPFQEGDVAEVNEFSFPAGTRT